MTSTLVRVSLLSAGLCAATATATPPTAIEGVFYVVDVLDDGTPIFGIEGDLDGTFVTYEGPGAVNLHECACTYAGHGEGDTMMIRTVEPRSSLGSGTWTITMGTGVLDTVHARGSWSFDEETLTGEYSGWGHFDPSHH